MALRTARPRLRWAGVALIVVVGLAFVNAAGSDARPAARGATKLTRVSVQLVWVAQAQFAPYFAAKEKGFYRQEGLDVTIKPGGPDSPIVPLVGQNKSQFGVLALGSVIQARDQNIPLVYIAQMQRRDAFRLVYFKKSGIRSIRDLRGKKVGQWAGTSSALELDAMLRKVGMDPQKDITPVQQSFDMTQLLAGKVDAASATTYNEFAQVIAAGHAPSELGLIDPNSLGVGFTVDGIIANSDWLKSAKNQQTAVRFLRASFRGAIFCRDHPNACVSSTLKVAPQLCRPLQNWMMNEINKTMWPSPNKIGYITPSVFKSGGAILRQYGGLTSPPDPKSIRTDLWKKAIKGLKSTTGEGFKAAALGPKDVSGC